MGIIAFLILGLIVGAIAKALLPGPDSGGLLMTTALGVAGALLGGFAGAALFDVDPIDEFFDLSTWLASTAGAVVVLAAYRMVTALGSSTRSNT